MSERSWVNPGPAPEIRRRASERAYFTTFLRSWWPALLWAGSIFILSTDSFSPEHTGGVIYPILHWFVPSLTQEQFEPIHHLIRKTAHFVEYFIFCVLVFRGVRGERRGWRWTWALAALSVAAVYSALDEIHQAFVASRTSSAWDSLLDSVGAFAATVAIYMWFRWRRSADSQR